MISTKPRRKPALLLGPVQHVPGRGQEHKSASEHGVAQQVDRAEMRVALPSEQCSQEVSGIVRKDIEAGVPRLEPAGDEIDGERKAVHLGEERD